MIMTAYTRLLIFTGLFFLCISAASAQKKDSTLITADFRNANMEQFVSELEKHTGLYFYYDPLFTDSIKINLPVTSQPLEKVMESAFEGSDFYYAIDEEGHVFITKGIKIRTKVSPKIVSQNKIAKPQPAAPTMAGEKESIIKKAPNPIVDKKVIEIGNRNLVNEKTNKATIAGYLTDIKTGEPVSGVSVSVPALKTGTITDQYGYFSLGLPKGKHMLLVQGIEIRETTRQIMVYGDGKVNIELENMVMTLKNVTITAQKLNNIRNTQMGIQRMEISAIKQIPVVFGEADILKAVTALPGVKTVGEASTGLNVRGGSPDQNLILFNDVTIFNPTHFFGMFSALNPEIVKDVELYKSSIPARYGGRLSSVINITGREGNKKNISGSAGIGVLTSRLNIEGPLIKDKSSFIIGGRTTYANWLLDLLPDQYKKSRASFYDINLSITHQVNKKSSIYITGYMSKDRFNLNNDTTYQYSNKNAAIKLKHVFNNKLTGTFGLGYDFYEYNISSDQVPLIAYKLNFDISQTNLRTLFTYYLNNKNTIESGLSSIYYKLHPGNYLPSGTESIVNPDHIPPEQALETAAFVSDRYTFNSRLSAEAGLRFSVFNYLGPGEINSYPHGVPKTEDNKIGVVSYSSGKFIKTYSAPEVRTSLRYAFNDSFSIKASYNSQKQYIHLISNTTAMAPTDIWKLSDPNIKPQSGDQVSLGLYRNFKSNTIEASVEVYYKRIKDYLDYTSGAELIMNHHLETDVVGTRGKAYGVELLLKKKSGKLNGWLSYTWARIFLKMDDPSTGAVINKGNYYPANYDIPHNLTTIGNYRINHRFSVSLNVTYASGRPFTLPIGRFYYANAPRTLYGDRNAYRIPYYFRSDFSMNIEGNHKIYQKTHNSWVIGVYNLTGRKNAYSVYYISENGNIKGYKLSIFGNAIPYINFNIRF